MAELNENIKVKKVKSPGKRIRDIKRLLENEKFQISDEKKIEFEQQIKDLQETITKNKGSYKKKLDRYLQYKKNKQKTIRFVELVKVKRKINQLQKLLVKSIKNDQINTENESEIEMNKNIDLNNPLKFMNSNLSENNCDQISRIKTEINIFKIYQDYIRLLPFFKERKYIPLFSNTELDSETLEKRKQYINDVQELKEKLRRNKVKTLEINNTYIKDSFLLENDNFDESQNSKKEIRKIEYSIGGNKRNNNNSKKSVKKISDKHETCKLKFNNYQKSESEVKTKTEILNNHIIFSESD